MTIRSITTGRKFFDRSQVEGSTNWIPDGSAPCLGRGSQVGAASEIPSGYVNIAIENGHL